MGHRQGIVRKTYVTILFNYISQHGIYKSIFISGLHYTFLVTFNLALWHSYNDANKVYGSKVENYNNNNLYCHVNNNININNINNIGSFKQQLHSNEGWMPSGRYALL